MLSREHIGAMRNAPNVTMSADMRRLLIEHIDEQQAEIERLKIKSNQYAKRLVLDGYNDVSWEAGGMLFTPKEDSDADQRTT